MRILTVIKTSESMKVIIRAIYKSVPSLINLAFIVCFVILIISINTMAAWRGSFYFCNSFSQITEPIISKTDCLEKGGQWMNKNLNFDDITHACLSFFIIIVGTNWQEILYSCLDSVGIEKQPIYNYNIHNIITFYVFILFGNILLFNLFIVVVIDNFKQMKEIVGGYLLLTREQREWVDLQRFILRKNLKISIQKPENFIRNICYKISMNKNFEAFIFLTIVFDFALLMSVYKGMSTAFEEIVFTANIAVLTLYNLEILIKIIGFGRLFFKDSWNL